MDDYEVELIDYLRVLWWGKWIILGCLLVAVGTSALWVVLQPTTHSGSVELQLRQYVTAALGGDQAAAASMKSALTAALSAVEETIPEVASTVSKDGTIVTLSLSRTALPPDVLQKTLEEAGSELTQLLAASLKEELSHLATRTELQKASLSAQLELLRQSLDEQRSNDAPLSVALAEQIARLEAQLAQHQVRLATLKTADFSELFVLSPVGEPKIVSSVPNRSTTIAVAGLLGLLVGVLLAFFVHYLLQVRAREQGIE